MADNDAAGTLTKPSAKSRRGRRNVSRLVALLTLLVAGGAAVFAFLPDPSALAAASALSGKARRGIGDNESDCGAPETLVAEGRKAMATVGVFTLPTH